MEIKEEVIGYLNFLVRTYDDVTRTIASAKNRIQAINKEADPDNDPIVKELESRKGNLARRIEKYLDNFPLWGNWLQHIPGIGAWIAGKLIIMYYFRFTAVCPDCGSTLEKKDGTLYCSTCDKSVKGDGVLKHRIEIKDFPTVSKLWAYMGMHCDETGVKPKRKAGQQSNWSTQGRTICYQVGDQFNRQKEDHPYKAFLLRQKKKHEKKHPEWSKGHIHNAAKNEAAKLFLAHLWTVARTMDGKPVSLPYTGTIMGHTNIIEPFYWEPLPTLNTSIECEQKMAVNE